MKKNLERLSSGCKINRAGDNAAGLAISEKMCAQITGLETAQKNAKDGISLVQTAEGALTEVHDMLNRMVELATMSANGTYDNTTDRAQLQKEMDQLKDEINRIADSSNFNGIKLLDGNLSKEYLTVDGVTSAFKSVTAGLDINDAVNGNGGAATATIKLTQLFGTDDTLKFEFDTTGTPTGAGVPATATLAFGADFKGDTLEEQAKSIAEALGKKSDIALAFDINVDGTTITMTNKTEGASEAYVKSVTAADKTVVFGTGTYTAGTNGANKAAEGGFDNLFEGNSDTSKMMDLKEGDVLTFTFKDSLGNQTLVAQIKVTADMIGDTDKETTANIVDALNNAKFIDITEDNLAAMKELTGNSSLTATVADESRFKVSDLFDITANTKPDGTSNSFGSIQVGAKLNGQFDIASVKRTNAEDSTRTKTVAATVCDTPGDANVAGTYVVTGGSENFTKGDVIEISGALSDGRTFTLKLTAGEDFTIGANYKATLDNLKTLLEKTDDDDAYMVELSDGSKVKAGDIFGSGKEFTITTAAGGITFESVKKGPLQAGVAGAITSVMVNTAAAEVAVETARGKDGSAAESSFTFSEGVDYGTAVTVDGKTYELVKDARDTSNRGNVAVVVDDISDLKAVAKAFADAINKEAPDWLDADGKTKAATAPATGNVKAYTASVDGTTVKVTTEDKGSTVKALEVTTPYGDEIPTVSFQFDPTKILEGSYMTVSDGTNSHTYEFVKTGGKASSGRTAIEIDDFNKMTSKSIADAFKAVNKNGIVDVADDGTITMQAEAADDGSVAKLKLSFYNGKGGLTLQIGDTAESYNQLNVSISDCHTYSLGIEDISIADQDNAQAAIDSIKAAINYVSDVRGTLGATQNRLDHTINNLSVMTENIQDAESTIRDTDIAEEMMAYTKNNILIQASQAMLAQANQVPQGVLQLLQ